MEVSRYALPRDSTTNSNCAVVDGVEEGIGSCVKAISGRPSGLWPFPEHAPLCSIPPLIWRIDCARALHVAEVLPSPHKPTNLRGHAPTALSLVGTSRGRLG
jgi:hypothetical protein